MSCCAAMTLTSPPRHVPAAPLVTADFAWLVAAHFIQALAWSAMLLFPVYLAHLGASRVEIGAVMGAAPVGGLLLRPLVGWSLDAWGRKKTLAVGTVVTAASMFSIYAIEDIGPVAWAMRFVFGMGVGTLFTGYFVLCADVVPEARRTEGIALFGISGLLPLLVNPFAAQIGIAAADLRWFLPLTGLSVLLSLLALARVREPVKSTTLAGTLTPTGHGRVGLREVLGALTEPRLRSVWLITLVFASLIMLFASFATVAAGARGLARPSDFWLTYAAGAICVRLLGARLPDRLGVHNMVAPALAVLVVGALLMAGAQTTRGLQIAGLLAGLGHGFGFPVLASLVTARSTERVRGSALAMFTALWDVSLLVVPPLLGAVADAAGDAVMFALAAVLAIGGLLIWTLLEHRWGARPGRRGPMG